MAQAEPLSANPEEKNAASRKVPGSNARGVKLQYFRKEAEKRLNVCPECNYHMYVSGTERINQVLDEGTFEEWDANVLPTDPLDFADKKAYKDRLG